MVVNEAQTGTRVYGSGLSRVAVPVAYIIQFLNVSSMSPSQGYTMMALRTHARGMANTVSRGL